MGISRRRTWRNEGKQKNREIRRDGERTRSRKEEELLNFQEKGGGGGEEQVGW